MFRRILSFVFVATALVAVRGAAQEQSKSSQTQKIPQTPVQQKQAAKSTLADFDWLVGNWRAEMKEGRVEQVIWPARGGEIAGMFQLWNGDQTLAIELFNLRQTGAGVEMRIRHFTPELKPWEKEPIVLNVTEHSATRTVFTNFINADPKRTVVTRNGNASFTSRVEIVGQDGTEKNFELTLYRVQ